MIQHIYSPPGMNLVRSPDGSVFSITMAWPHGETVTVLLPREAAEHLAKEILSPSIEVAKTFPGNGIL